LAEEEAFCIDNIIRELIFEQGHTGFFVFTEQNGLFSIAALMLGYNKVRIKLQNTIAEDRN